MKKLLVVLCLLAAGPALAVDIPFRDGSVVDAASYTVTGSYVMVEMPGGGRVAYDVADIDLEALRRAEAAAIEPEEAAGEAATVLGQSVNLAMPEDGSSGGLTITDQHVKHVRGSGIAGPEDATEEEPAAAAGAVPEGFEEGGRVVLNNLSVDALDDGQWEVRGEIVNRASDVVFDVRANLQGSVPDGEPWTASVPVAAQLAPDSKGEFRHTFPPPEGVAEGWRPQVRVNIIWKQGETRLEPNYDRTAPHPSGLPVDRGGVGGVDVRKDEEIEL